MDMIGKVRRLKLRDQFSLSEIAKRTGLSRNTVKKWLKAPGDAVPKYERTVVAGKLTPFEPVLHQALATDSHRPKQGRRSGRALFAQIQAQGYRGGYSAVTDYIRRWRVESAASPAKAFVPLSFELGEAFQFDWSDEAMVVGGVFYNVQVAHLKLCASRAFWLVAYDWQHYIDLVQRKPGALRNGTPFLDLPAPLLRLRQSLLRHPGGDRVMAQVLAVVPQAGLEAVLVAVELVLEGMAPSGSISVEHVRNVLARLNNPATPAQAQTSLRLSELPKADTARYDRLRPTHLDPVNPLACSDGQEAHHA